MGKLITVGGGFTQVNNSVKNGDRGAVKPYVAPRDAWSAPPEALNRVKGHLVNLHGEQEARRRISEMTDKEVVDLDLEIRVNTMSADTEGQKKPEGKPEVKPYIAPTFDDIKE